MTPPVPLDNFPLIRSRDIEAVRNALARIYAEPKLTLERPDGKLDAAVNECRLNAVKLSYAGFGAALSVEFPAADYFVQLIALRGKGEIISRNTQVTMAAGSSATISPGAGFKANYCDEYEYIVLKIDQQALTKKLIAMTGTTIGEPLRTNPRVEFTRPAAKLLQQYLGVLIDTLGGAHLPLPAWWVSQTEQLLMAMFLHGHRHNYSHLLEQETADAAPWQVRRAEEYIEANWQRPITLEDLAEVTGVSALSLFRTYKRSRGISPLQYAMQVRVRRGSAR